MAAIRQISVLFLFVALICQYGHADERDKRQVGGLQNFFLKLLHPVDLAYLRYRPRFNPKINDKIEFPDDIFKTLDDYEDSEELDDYFSNPFKGDDGLFKNSKEEDCDDDKHEKEYAKIVDGKPKGPKQKEPKFKPSTKPPKDIPKINKPLFQSIFPGVNGGINDRFNPFTIPTSAFFGNKGRPNYIPIGGAIIAGYYPNPWQQMYNMVQLSNGQVVLVPKPGIFGPNKGPPGAGYGPIFLPRSTPIFGPGSYIPRIDYNRYPFPFNYGFDKGFGPGGRNLRIPRSFQAVPRYSESYDDAVDDNVSAAIKDEAKPSSPKDKNEDIVAKEDENKEIKDKEYIKYD